MTSRIATIIIAALAITAVPTIASGANHSHQANNGTPKVCKRGYHRHGKQCWKNHAVVVVGPAGAAGAAGSNGTTGSAGTSGQDGTNGVNGVDGQNGTEGPQGEVGPEGPQGEVGPEGPQGEVGPEGADDCHKPGKGTPPWC